MEINYTEINYSEIGKRIKEERVKQNLSQQYLAELSELSPTYVSHIERGKTKLSLPSLISIANALYVPVDQLLMDVVLNSEVQFKKEFAEILNKCTIQEYRLLINASKAILETLHREK